MRPFIVALIGRDPVEAYSVVIGAQASERPHDFDVALVSFSSSREERMRFICP